VRFAGKVHARRRATELTQLIDPAGTEAAGIIDKSRG
jgi:hypothetical protein